ncbi:MAG: hypothetical protein AABZ77_02105 [Chloroflexota bacterium]
MGKTTAVKTCPVCAKVVNAQVFGTHMWGAHGIRTGVQVTLNALAERVNALEDKLDKFVPLTETRNVNFDGKIRHGHVVVYECADGECHQAKPKVAEPAPGPVKIVCKSPVTVAHVHTPGLVVQRESNKGGLPNKKP